MLLLPGGMLKFSINQYVMSHLRKQTFGREPQTKIQTIPSDQNLHWAHFG